jgi:hypothetical protein
MDNKFQTSFIPKSPVVAESQSSGSGLGLFLIIGLLIFIISVLASVGAYFWRESLISQVVNMQTDLSTRRDKIDEVTIDALLKLDRRLRISQSLLNQHLMSSSVFSLLEENTVTGVRFRSFTFTANDDGTYRLHLSGQAKNFKTIAFQSVQFNKMSKVILNPIFSNFNPTQDGSVNFDFDSNIENKFVNYSEWKNNLGGQGNDSSQSQPQVQAESNNQDATSF